MLRNKPVTRPRDAGDYEYLELIINIIELGIMAKNS